MLNQRAGLLIAGPSQPLTSSKLGAPFEPVVSFDMQVTVRGSNSVATRAEVTSGGSFEYNGRTHKVAGFYRTKDAFLSADGTNCPNPNLAESYLFGAYVLCTVYVMRKDTGAIYAYVPLPRYSSGWGVDGRMLGFPINDAAYTNPRTGKPPITDEDLGKTVDFVCEIYSEYIDSRPAPTEPQKYRMHVYFPFSHPYRYSEISPRLLGYSCQYAEYYVPQMASLGGYESRITFDDIVLPVPTRTGVVGCVPLTGLRNGTAESSGPELSFGPHTVFWLAAGQSIPWKALTAQLYRDGDTAAAAPLTSGYGSENGGPDFGLTEGQSLPSTEGFPLRLSDIGKNVDLYYQLLSST